MLINTSEERSHGTLTTEWAAHKDHQRRSAGRIRWFSRRIVEIFSHQPNTFLPNYVSVMAILIRHWPIVNLFLCNYTVSVWGKEKVCVSVVWSLVYVLPESGWRNEALNYPAAWVSLATQHVFLIASELVGDDTHRESTPEKSAERGSAKRAAGLITTKLLNYPSCGQVNSAQTDSELFQIPHPCDWILTLPCLQIFLHLRETGGENPS